MSKVLIIGCGGVASVAIHKCCQVPEVFTDICIASRTKSKCDKLAAELAPKTTTRITTAQVDADHVDEVIALIKSYQPDLVMNIALPYHCLLYTSGTAQMKQYDVKISHAALSDMEQIYSYIADRLLQPDTAMGQYNRIAEAIQSLNILPERCALVESEPERTQGLRQMLVDNYSVFYIVGCLLYTSRCV